MAPVPWWGAGALFFLTSLGLRSQSDAAEGTSEFAPRTRKRGELSDDFNSPQERASQVERWAPLDLTLCLPGILIEILSEFARRENIEINGLIKRWIDERVDQEREKLREKIRQKKDTAITMSKVAPFFYRVRWRPLDEPRWINVCLTEATDSHHALEQGLGCLRRGFQRIGKDFDEHAIELEVTVAKFTLSGEEFFENGSV